jgi:predicted RNase H-like nuclease
MFLGVDGCRDGWVGVLLDKTGAFAAVRAHATLEDLADDFPGAEPIAIDMPLHLLDGAVRKADREARRFLGPRGRSVFPAPPRFILEQKWIAGTHAMTNAECKRRFGQGLSAQSFALRHKISEANRALAEGRPIIEVHPEVTFQWMHDGQPLPYPKKCWGGFHLRRQLLQEAGVVIPERIPESAARAAPDDILDAAAGAISARRQFLGEARHFPAEESLAGSPVIWF